MKNNKQEKVKYLTLKEFNLILNNVPSKSGIHGIGLSEWKLEFTQLTKNEETYGVDREELINVTALHEDTQIMMYATIKKVF